MPETIAREPILITGIGKRLGHALATDLLDKGFPVIGTYRTQRDSLSILEQQGAELHHCDFYQTDSLNQFLTNTKNRHSALRAIVHNASDWLPDNAELPHADIFNRMMQVHAGAPYQINLALTPLLMSNSHDYADIIHIGDYVSGRGSKKHIAYAASKAAQDNLTLSFAASLAPKVKVNSIAPALMLFNDQDDEEYRAKTLKKSLMQRVGGNDEFLKTVFYLLESHYITGRILHLDGGRQLK